MRAAAGLVLGALLASACRFATVTVPEGSEKAVVHAVLNPAASEQVILIEQTLTGRFTLPENDRSTRLDPIVTGGGIPISGADVRVFGEGGDSVIAVEDADVRPDHLGAGVYRFPSTDLEGLPIRPGKRYDLRVITPAGDTITGSTVVPPVQVLPADPTSYAMNRDRDTLRLYWDAVAPAARYVLHIDTPYGPTYLFTSQLEARFPGSLRNFLQESLFPAFLPGFESTVWLYAVDPNYFDYFRSQNDPFTGTGLITRLHGGLGVFGSLGVIYVYRVFVTATIDDPIEGDYILLAQSGADLAPDRMILYVESEGAGRTAFTGRYDAGATAATGGVSGTLRGTDLTLHLLASRNSLSDTISTYTAQVRGDTLVGTFRRDSTATSIARFVKR